MPYRAMTPPQQSFDMSLPKPRRTKPGWILAASARAHVAVLGTVALFHREPPKPPVAVVRVMTAEARGGITEPMTMQITGFRVARVRSEAVTR